MARACRAELDKGLSGLAFLDTKFLGANAMIQNNEDLLPLGSVGVQTSIYSDAPVPSAHDTPDDFGDFSARVAETFDSVDLLIAARAEAEEAEARAKAAGETPLPFAKKRLSSQARRGYFRRHRGQAEQPARKPLARRRRAGSRLTGGAEHGRKRSRRPQRCVGHSDFPVRPRFSQRRGRRGELRRERFAGRGRRGKPASWPMSILTSCCA